MDYQGILENLYPDGSIGGECGVFVHKLIQIPLVGNTIQSKTAAVRKYGYTAQMVQGGYDAGDAIVFNVDTPAGHIGFCNNIENGVMTITESNWNLDNKIHHTRQVSVLDKSIVGCLRGKLLFPIPTFNQRVLVLCYNIPWNQFANLAQGIESYADKVKAKTTVFNISVDFEPTEAIFPIITQPSDGTIYVDPEAISAEGSRIQTEKDKQYDVVCLVYDNSEMNPKPNHPIEAPIFEHGFNVIEIPLDWISSLDDPTIPFEIYSQSVEIFFAHECMHADYFLSKSGQRDKTHDPQTLGYPSPVDYFLDYLMELSPYWGIISK